MSESHSFFEAPSTDESPKRNAAAAAPSPAAPGTFDQQSEASRLLPEIRNALNSARLCAAFLERQLSDVRSDSELIDALKTIENVIDRVSELATELAHESRKPAGTTADSATASRERAAELATRGVRDVAPIGSASGSELLDLEQCLNELVRAATQTALNGGRVLVRARHQLSVSATLPSLPAITQRVAV